MYVEVVQEVVILSPLQCTGIRIIYAIGSDIDSRTGNGIGSGCVMIVNDCKVVSSYPATSGRKDENKLKRRPGKAKTLVK